MQMRLILLSGAFWYIHMIPVGTNFSNMYGLNANKVVQHTLMNAQFAATYRSQFTSILNSRKEITVVIFQGERCNKITRISKSAFAEKKLSGETP